MAPKRTAATQAGVNVDLLKNIQNGTVKYISKDDGMPLLKAGLIQVDINQTDAVGNALVALTEAGVKMVGNSTPTGAVAPVSPYAILSGVQLPVSKRGFAKGGGAPTQYPFDKLEVGQSFFVPVSEKHPNPVKTLGSTVSAQNFKYSEETGETEQKERAKRGKKNKAVLDENGNKIMETVTVKLRRPLRKFSIRPVKAGVAYGSWTPEADGAVIARTL